MGKLFEELKRCKAFFFAAVYTAAVAWLFIHFYKTVLPAFDASNWQLSGLVIPSLLFLCTQVG